jgi:fibro-slime domain-containing protein
MARITSLNRVSSWTFVLASTLIAAAGLAQTSIGGEDENDAFANLPSTMQLTGTVRDFAERTAPGGHPDFERQPTAGFGHYIDMVENELDADRKPVFRSTGAKIGTQWRDSSNRNIINPKPYIQAKSSDRAGSSNSASSGSSTTAANFQQWFRDVPGINLSKPVSITLTRQAGTSTYVFDDKLDSNYNTVRTTLNPTGFFPINGDLLGNSNGNTNNYHFSYELATQFIYQAGSGQVFTFTGDDDVWVYIDGKLVIDLGGVHSAISQTIDLDRLAVANGGWLQTGQQYDLRFFFAERHRTQSNFRISTTLQLRNVEAPQVATLYD